MEVLIPTRSYVKYGGVGQCVACGPGLGKGDFLGLASAAGPPVIGRGSLAEVCQLGGAGRVARLCVASGQGDHEARPLSGAGARRLDGPLVGVDDGFADGQSDAGSGVVAASRGVAAIEPFEDVG